MVMRAGQRCCRIFGYRQEILNWRRCLQSCIRYWVPGAKAKYQRGFPDVSLLGALQRRLARHGHYRRLKRRG